MFIFICIFILQLLQDQKIHVFHHLVDQTVNVGLSINKLYVLVFLITSDHRQHVDLNVLSALNVHQIELVSIKDVLILVQIHADFELNVLRKIITQYALVLLVLLEIHFLNVHLSVSIFIINFSILMCRLHLILFQTILTIR